MVALLASRVPDVKLHAQWPHIYRLRQKGRCKAKSFYHLFLLCLVVFIKEAPNQRSTTGHGMKKNIYTHTAVSAELKKNYTKKKKKTRNQVKSYNIYRILLLFYYYFFASGPTLSFVLGKPL